MADRQADENVSKVIERELFPGLRFAKLSTDKSVGSYLQESLNRAEIYTSTHTDILEGPTLSLLVFIFRFINWNIKMMY